ncbi:MAG: tRNA uridine-5-carboxymethylaminomethyl(34) synthesis GTPase MnmE [Bacteriovoracaceae bacterium]|jgi:tRNA modification GTPase|nr:tRNA uridine-5-carboxymethylaminomethyl(34) synthesis GTPase MnmE [Bacteriovoracaceae bacterium]
MEFLFDDGPIIACSTGQYSNAAISLIRISGFEELSCFNNCFGSESFKPTPKMAEFKKLYNLKGSVLDEVVVNFFKAPHSYTGENILEIGVHGNLLNVQRIIDFFEQNLNFRVACPGEFTYRALKNKKMTLTQVEGLDLLLNAQSNFALDQGQSILSGSLNSELSSLHHNYLKLRAALELSIDFSEDVGEEAVSKEIANWSASLNKLLSGLKSRVSSPIKNILSPQIALVGPVNAGKSSLFNNFLNTNRSIVSSEKGTTRDFISEYINFDGTHYKIVDTAGLRHGESDIEREGIKRSLEVLKDSFYKIFVVNPCDYLGQKFDQLKGEEFDLVVVTHSDVKNGECPNFEFPFKAETTVQFSNTSEANSEMSVDQIMQLVSDKFKRLSESKPILIERQRSLISRAHKLSEEFLVSAKSQNDVAILSSQLYVLGSVIEELVGVVRPDDVLGSIFSNFCIGK